MRAANRALLALVAFAAASAACRQSPPEANLAIDNGAAVTTDIETLPPDESVEAPANELLNGDGEPTNVDGAQY